MVNANFDGGPAFPRPKWWPTDGDPDHDGHEQGGMSLRDYFAAKAMASLLSNLDLRNVADIVAQAKGQTARALIAEKAYQYADALLAERAKAVDRG